MDKKEYDKHYYQKNKKRICKQRQKHRKENHEEVIIRERKSDKKRYGQQRELAKTKYRKQSLARYKLRNKIKSGEIKRQLCEACGEANANAHHEDYDKPFDVIWLCNKCHGIKHRKY